MNALQKYEIHKRLFLPMARMSLLAIIFVACLYTLEKLNQENNFASASLEAIAAALWVTLMAGTLIAIARAHSNNNGNWLDNWKRYSGYQTPGDLNPKSDLDILGKHLESDDRLNQKTSLVRRL